MRKKHLIRKMPSFSIRTSPTKKKKTRFPNYHKRSISHHQKHRDKPSPKPSTKPKDHLHLKKKKHSHMTEKTFSSPTEKKTIFKPFRTDSPAFSDQVRQLNLQLEEDKKLKYEQFLRNLKTVTEKKNHGVFISLRNMFPNLIDRNGKKIVLEFPRKDLRMTFDEVLKSLEDVKKSVLDVENMEQLKKMTKRERFLRYYKNIFLDGIRNWKDYSNKFDDFVRERKKNRSLSKLYIERMRFDEEFLRFKNRKNRVYSLDNIKYMIKIDQVSEKKLISKIELSNVNKVNKIKLTDEIKRWKLRSGTPRDKNNKIPYDLKVLLNENKKILMRIKKENDRNFEINIINQIEDHVLNQIEDNNLGGNISVFLTNFLSDKESHKNQNSDDGKNSLRKVPAPSPIGVNPIKLDFSIRNKNAVSRSRYNNIKPIFDSKFDENKFTNKIINEDKKRKSYAQFNYSLLNMIKSKNQDDFKSPNKNEPNLMEKIYDKKKNGTVLIENPQQKILTKEYYNDKNNDFRKKFGKMLQQFEIRLLEYNKNYVNTNDEQNNKKEKIKLKVNLVKIVGTGASSTVYQGFLKINNNDKLIPIAIKKVSLKNNFVKKELVVSEISILRQFKNKFLVKYYGIKYSNHEKDLNDLIKKKKKFSENETSLILTHLLKGLQFLYRNKIIHRDLKSSNILVNELGEIKVSDFGVSAILSKYDQTRVSCVGTPNFSSVEILKGEEYSFQTDIWSLGCVVLHCLTGLLPFHEFNTFKIAVEVPKINIKEYIGKLKVSDIAKDFLSKCLQENWKDRPLPQELLKHPFVNKEVKLLKM